MSLVIKDFRKIRTPFAFLDETGSINSKSDRYFCLGMIRCMQPMYLDSKIRMVRHKFNFYDEIKWNTISKAKLKFLIKVLDEVFSEKGIIFSCIVINKDQVDFATKFNNDPYLAYQKFSESLVENSIRDCEIFTILADFVSTPAQVQFERHLKLEINKRLDRLAVAGVYRVDSKGVLLIQITDLLLGAVAYSLKKEAKLVKGDENKLVILKYIFKKINELDKGPDIKSFKTGLNKRRFKVFIY